MRIQLTQISGGVSSVTAIRREPRRSAALDAPTAEPAEAARTRRRRALLVRRDGQGIAQANALETTMTHWSLPRPAPASSATGASLPVATATATPAAVRWDAVRG
ncbi:MAG: hypothetical protein VCC04_13245 [Myxococcota bacterium]